MDPVRLSDLDLRAQVPAGAAHPSPRAWEDQVLYFLLVDRFSDGKEIGTLDPHGNVVATGSTPLFAPANARNAVRNEADAAAWREAGTKYVGGTLKGVESKLGYLKRMGITAIWVSPVLKQVPFQETYHGYGTQDFLRVNPRFGTAAELKSLVRAAHREGIAVVLDIILNHTGNVFGYADNRQHTRDPRWDGNPFPVEGFRDPQGRPGIPFAKPGALPSREIGRASCRERVLTGV